MPVTTKLCAEQRFCVQKVRPADDVVNNQCTLVNLRWRHGDYQLAVSDIFGGNAFLPVLFVPATLLSGHAVLPAAQRTDIYLTALGIVLTLIYAAGLLFRPRRRIARLGVDSLAVVILYGLGMVGLFTVSNMR